jgi:hypothetical protein
MNYCQHCGRPGIKPDDRFCEVCGGTVIAANGSHSVCATPAQQRFHVSASTQADMAAYQQSQRIMAMGGYKGTVDAVQCLKCGYCGPMGILKVVKPLWSRKGVLIPLALISKGPTAIKVAGAVGASAAGDALAKTVVRCPYCHAEWKV